MSQPCVKKALAYRPVRSDDIVALHALSLSVGWPHRQEDWALLLDCGSGFVAEQQGAVVGSALYWKCGADRGTLGLVIVSPAGQGHGIGSQLMELVFAELGERVTFLHATPAGKPLYEKLGFTACGMVDQHQGTIAGVSAPILSPGERLRPLVQDDVPQVIELASRASGLDRRVTIPALLKNAEGVLLERDGEPVGFSLFRCFGRGYAIGPVVAMPSLGELYAKSLITHWLSQRTGAFVRIDVPAGADLHEWLTAQGLVRVDSVVRMVRNASAAEHSGDPDPTFRMFGIINQAIG